MNYFKIRRNNKQFLALTTLTVSEFDELLPLFESSWNDYIEHYKLDGTRRTRKYVAKDPNVLSTIEEKLFFILCYNKNNSLQEFLAASFDMDQSMANRWIHALDPLLKTALSSYQAAQTSQQFSEKAVEDNTYIADATEREIQRPKYNQKENYSGKQKCHTIKNMIVVSLTGFIMFLSNTVTGKMSDKKLADTAFGSSKQIELLVDLGYLGYKSDNINVILPIKKRKKQELSKIQRKINQLHSRKRVLVEHCISSIKRLRIVKDVNRNTKTGFRELAMDIAVSMHNYRVTKRHVILLNPAISINSE